MLVILTVIVIPLIIVLYTRKPSATNHNEFSKSASCRFIFPTDKGSCHVISGVVFVGKSTIAQPMVIFFEENHTVPNVMSGWGYENDTAYGLITINDKTLKAPLGSVVQIGSENKLKVLSDSWDVSIYGDQGKTEDYVKKLLGLHHKQ